MTQKKNDARTKEIASMGAKAKNKLYPHTKGEFKTGTTRAILCGKKGHEKALEKNPEFLSQAGRKSRLHENIVASKLEGDHIFLPNEICDRIVVKDGEIYFVEIKQPDRKLTPKQKLFASFVKEQYQVICS